MAHFVFHVSGREFFDNLVVARSVWGFRQNASYRKTIAPEDKVLFYLSGQGNQVFLGVATLKSGAYKDETKESDSWYQESEMLRIDLKDVVVFPESRPRDGLQWRPQMGSASRISEEEFNTVLAGTSMKLMSVPAQAQTSEAQEFALEKYLEDFIVSNWKSIFGDTLAMYQDEDGNTGQQFYCDVGYIDLLARDKGGNFVVIELKKGRKNDEVVGQVLRYIGWVRRHLAEPMGVAVRGLIITKEHDERLTYALQELSGKVELKNYQISFKLT